jgi:hypothetical protein
MSPHDVRAADDAGTSWEELQELNAEILLPVPWQHELQPCEFRLGGKYELRLPLFLCELPQLSLPSRYSQLLVTSADRLLLIPVTMAAQLHERESQDSKHIMSFLSDPTPAHAQVIPNHNNMTHRSLLQKKQQLNSST